MEKILNLCIKSGFADPLATRLKGDFSERAIYRVTHSKGTLIAVSGQNIPENEAFLSFRNTFEQNGFKVPAFITVSDDRKIYLLEDLGDVTVKKYCDQVMKLGSVEAVKKIYIRIMEKLPVIQTKLYGKIDYSKCYQNSVFCRENMESDIERFEEYFLKRYHKNYDPSGFHKFRNELILSSDNYGKNYFLYRDFQTRNIMMKNNDLYFIDFQSGRKGSFYYDIASFIYSSGTVKYDGMEDEISRSYYNSARHLDCDIDSFKTGIELFALVRVMQAVGNYAFYYYERKDDSIETKREHGLKTILKLSRSLNMEPGIYEG